MTRTLWYPGHELLLTDIVRAEGSYVYDSNGKRYVDLESGVWCASLGHGHPRILRAMTEQAERIAHNGFCYSSPIVDAAARDVLSLLGFAGGSCVFLCSGSEAVEYGVRVAGMLMERPLLMTMADSYFGAYGAAAARAKDGWHEFDWFPCAGCAHAVDGGDAQAMDLGGVAGAADRGNAHAGEGEIGRAPAGAEGDDEGRACDESCERWAAIPFDRIGGFLFEPGSSSGLVRFPPAKLIRAIHRRIREGGGFFLVNEVTTGTGRTGKWFGFQHYGIEPDIVAIGKGIGDGYPVSVTAFSPRTADRLGDRPVKYAGSHQNDPLGAAVLREVIRTIEDEGLIARAGELGRVLGDGLDAVRARCGRIREVRYRGMMAAIELNDGPANGFTIRVHHGLLDRGFIVGRRPGVPVLRIDPSLTIEREEIGRFLAVLEEVVMAEGSDDGSVSAGPTGSRS